MSNSVVYTLAEDKFASPVQTRPGDTLVVTHAFKHRAGQKDSIQVRHEITRKRIYTYSIVEQVDGTICNRIG